MPFKMLGSLVNFNLLEITHNNTALGNICHVRSLLTEDQHLPNR